MEGGEERLCPAQEARRLRQVDRRAVDDRAEAAEEPLQERGRVAEVADRRAELVGDRLQQVDERVGVDREALEPRQGGP